MPIIYGYLFIVIRVAAAEQHQRSPGSPGFGAKDTAGVLSRIYSMRQEHNTHVPAPDADDPYSISLKYSMSEEIQGLFLRPELWVRHPLPSSVSKWNLLRTPKPEQLHFGRKPQAEILCNKFSELSKAKVR
jgi:hypothetical protein